MKLIRRVGLVVVAVMAIGYFLASKSLAEAEATAEHGGIEGP